jgi:hypothetical protein
LETTHDDVRFAVEPASGGSSGRGLLPRSLTIYARSLGSVRVGCQLDQTQVGLRRERVDETHFRVADHVPETAHQTVASF